MRFKNVMLSGVAALAIMSTSANAAVALENDGTGDYLLFPATYSTQDGSWNTHLKVVNTNTTHAVVARVVIRNAHDSSELFDFPIYLTPQDAWEGTLQVGENSGNTDRVVVKTSDDSSMLWSGRSGTIVRADVSGPLELTVPNDDPKFGAPNSQNDITDGRTSTYVEVFGLAAYDATDIDAGWTINTPLDKEAFFEYARNVVNGTPKTQQATPGPLNNLYGNTYDVDSDALFGKQVINNDAAKLNMAYNGVALSEMATQAMTISVIGTATKHATMSNKGVSGVVEMYDELAKNLIYVMNEGVDENTSNPMRIHFTDPVKKYVFEYDPVTMLSLYSIDSGNKIIDWYYEYNQMAHDMSENPAYCEEEGGNTDFSNDGFGTKDCSTTKVYWEVEKIGDADVEYIFPAGGFLTYRLENQTAVVPTTFSSSVLSGSPVNYHIGNQSELAD